MIEGESEMAVAAMYGSIPGLGPGSAAKGEIDCQVE